MSTLLTINGTNKASLIDWKSLQVDEVLTKSANTCSFLIKKFNSQTYKPTIGQEVILTITGTIEFAGYIIEINEITNARVEYVQIVCKDYTHALDKYLVSTSYENMTVEAIISDILTNFTDGTFTDTNVNCPINVEKIVFNYLPVSKCIEKLIDVAGNYDWYVDYSKDLHLFNNTTISAPFGLTDTSGNYVYNSLTFKQDSSQLKNDVIVRGGNVVATTTRTEYLSGDGTSTVYPLASKFANVPVVRISTVVKTVGIDFIDDASSFDVLWNYNEKSLKFTVAPTAGTNNIDVTEYPEYPLIVEKTDEASITTYGISQSIIVDKTLKDLETANLRATVELLKYSNPLKVVSFKTYTKGLLTGQSISIQSTIRSISETLKIQNIRKSLTTPDTDKMQFTVNCINTEDLGINDILTRLLVKNQADQIEVSQDEYISRIRGLSDSMTITDSTPTATTTAPPYVYDTATWGFSTYS